MKAQEKVLWVLILCLCILGGGSCSPQKLDTLARGRQFLASAKAITQNRFLAQSTGLLPWASPDSIVRLSQADLGTQFFSLTNHFEAEINKFYCGVASAVIVMNCLRSENPRICKPCDPSHFTGSPKFLPEGLNPVFHRYTQNNFFTDKTEKVKGKMEIFGQPRSNGSVEYGLQLNELSEMLLTHNLASEVFIAQDKLASEEVVNSLIRAVKKPNHYVIANYSRKIVGQGNGNHISPIAAYDHVSNSFLVLDVNPSVATWSWIESQFLAQAMQTFDTVQNRGFLEISESYP